MAAREDQAETVILDRAVVGAHVMLLGVDAHELGEAAGPLRQRPIAAQAIDRPPARRDGDPRARVGRHAVARPGGHGGGEGVLHRVLGELEVADVPDQGREDRRSLLAEGTLDGGGRVGGTRPPLAARVHAWACAACSGDGIEAMSITGRTSIDP